MNANKLFSEFSLKKIWDKLLQHDKAMSSTLLILSSSNWVKQEDGTFKNIVSYATFKENDKLNVDLYDDGTLTETQLNEYEQYIDGFEIVNGALVATADTKPTQTMTVVVKGDFEVDATVGDVSQITDSINKLGGFTPIIDSTGKITGYKTNVGGADTVFPFSSGGNKADIIKAFQYSNLGLTEDMEWDEIIASLSTVYPNWEYLIYKGVVYVTPRIVGTIPSVGIVDDVLLSQYGGYDGSTTAYFDTPLHAKSGDVLVITYKCTNTSQVGTVTMKVSSTSNHSADLLNKVVQDTVRQTYEFVVPNDTDIYVSFTFAYRSAYVSEIYLKHM